MDHKQLNQLLDFTVNESYSSSLKIPLWIWGKHGMGKTTAVKNWCKNNKVECICLHTSTQDPGDLIGVPYVENGMTKWGRPEWFPKDDGRKYVVFLDELNRANTDVLQCMLPFALEGKLHTHQLPQNAVVIAAGNPNTDDYSVTSVDDKALLSRFGHFILNTGINEWKEYVTQEKFDISLLGAFNKSNSPGFKHLTLSEIGVNVEPDPRSLELVGKKLVKMNREQIDSIGQDFVSMFLGAAFAVLWRKEKDSELETFDARRIMKEYPKIQKDIKSKLDGDIRRNDLIGITIETIADIARQEGLDKKEDKPKLDNIAMFLLDVGAVGIQLFMDIMSKDAKLGYVVQHMSASKLKGKDGRSIVGTLASVVSTT